MSQQPAQPVGSAAQPVGGGTSGPFGLDLSRSGMVGQRNVETGGYSYEPISLFNQQQQQAQNYFSGRADAPPSAILNYRAPDLSDGSMQTNQPDIFNVRQDYQAGNFPAMRRDFALAQGLPAPGGGGQAPIGGGGAMPVGPSVSPPAGGFANIVSTGQQPQSGTGLASPAAGPAVSAFSPQALSQMAQLYQNPFLGAQMYGNMLNTSMYGPQGNAAWDASRFLTPGNLSQWGFAQPQGGSGGMSTGVK